MKKKVLIIVTCPFDGYGITMVVKNYCERLKQYVEFDFLLCAGYEKNEYDFFLKNGFNVYSAVCLRIRHPFRYVKWLTSFLKEKKYDCVHVHGNSGTLFFDIHAAKKAGIKNRIAHCHNTSCRFKIVHFLLKNRLNKEITNGLACSEKAGEWLFKNHFTVLKNAIDTNLFFYSQSYRQSLRREYGVTGDKILLHVGRMHAQKNQLFLIDVMKKLVGVDRSYKLFMIGDGEMLTDVKKRIEQYKLTESVFLLGKKQPIGFYYSFADMFVFPSIYEGFGLVAVEAQSSGLPVIASCAVPPEVNITNLVRHLELDVDLWAKNIESFFESKKTDREKISIESINLIKKHGYDIDENCKKLMSIYNLD